MKGIPHDRTADFGSRRSGERVKIREKNSGNPASLDKFTSADRKIAYDNLVTAAYRDICSGTPLSCVREKVKEGEYGMEGLSQNNADRVVRLAFKRMQADTDLECEELRSIFFGRYETLYRLCLEARDRQTALRCIDSMVKLTGVARPEKQQIEVKAGEGVVINFGLPELKEAEYEEIADGQSGIPQLEADAQAAGDMGRDS